MNVEIEAEAAQFPEKEYINGIAVAAQGEHERLQGEHSRLQMSMQGSRAKLWVKRQIAKSRAWIENENR